jgi:hypothetical protein
MTMWIIRRFLATLLTFGLIGCATVETGPPRDVAGKWIGQCQNCPVQKFEMVLHQDGAELRGTVQATPRTGLGTLPMALRDGKLDGRNVSFYTETADGIPFKVSLRLSGDGKRLDGHGTHRAGFPLFFGRE